MRRGALATEARTPRLGSGGYAPRVDPLLVIMNADAGTAAEETLEQGLEVLRAAYVGRGRADVEPRELDGVLHRAGSRRIVVAGGDGSLHAVVAALHRRHDLADAVIALLPMGTGNDFARAMDIPLEIEEAARVCSRARSGRST